VKKALYLILSDLLHILRIKTSAETVHWYQNESGHHKVLRVACFTGLSRRKTSPQQSVVVVVRRSWKYFNNRYSQQLMHEIFHFTFLN
jgi:hypothetical protein